MPVYEHKKTGQRVRPVPGSKEHQRLRDSDSFREARPNTRANPENAGTDPAPARRSDTAEATAEPSRKVTGRARINTKAGDGK